MLQVHAKYLFGNAVASVGDKTLEQRVREIADENAMTLSEVVREALRCFIVCYDKPLEPKR